MKIKFILLFVFLLMYNSSKSQTKIKNYEVCKQFRIMTSNTIVGSMYQLQRDGINVGEPIAGNGGDIYFKVTTDKYLMKDSGTYTYLKNNINSLSYAKVIVYEKQSITEDITIKQGETYNSYTNSGQYIRVLHPITVYSCKCDSVVTTNLTVTQ